MIPNTNETTGLAYGVVDSRTFHWVADDIFNNGENLSEREYLDELKGKVESLVSEVPLSTKESRVVEEIMDVLWSNMELQIEEPNYIYATGPTKYLMSYLGGAPLIWITESAWACPCRACSPCVPNGGDLSNPTTLDESNTIAHCPEPDEWKAAYEESSDMEIPPFLYPVENNEAQLDKPFDLWKHCGKTE